MRNAGNTRGGVIGYAAGPEEILKNVMAAKEEVLSHALTARAQFREESKMAREWKRCRMGLTPEKKMKKAAAESMVP